MTIGRIPSVEGGIQPTIVDAKGDLIAGVAADSINRLAVGSNDQVLVADSSTSTGLAWRSVATPFAAGKNAIINGDFRINQRGFTSQTDVIGYKFDRWRTENGTANLTASAQTFTPGAAPVAGYEAVNFMRMATTTANNANEYALLQQFIEDVRIFAGQTITVSFWAKASSGTPKIGVSLDQIFGSGGSSAVNGTGQSFTLSTSWARYSGTFAIPSISGKTIGTGSYLQLLFWITAGSTFNSRSGSVGPQSVTLDIWGVQVESGNVATPFQTATGTLQGELAACQRYYWRSSGQASCPVSTGMNVETTDSYFYVNHPVPMRTSPTTVDYSTLEVTDLYAYNTAVTNLVITSNSSGRNVTQVQATHGANGTRYRVAFLRNANNTAGYIGFSAEL